VAQAVKKAGTTDVDKVRVAMAGQTFKAPSGFTLTMDKTNHHLHKPVMIGEVAVTASSTWCGRPRVRSAPSRGARSSQVTKASRACNRINRLPVARSPSRDPSSRQQHQGRAADRQ